MTATAASPNSKSSKLWQSAKSRIFKTKNSTRHSYSPSHRSLPDVAPNEEEDDDVSSSLQLSPRIEFFDDWCAGTPTNKPARVTPGASKATTCTASTSPSTVNHALGTPGSDHRPRREDDFSSSCAASTAWVWGGPPRLPLAEGGEDEEERDGFAELVTERHGSGHHSLPEQHETNHASHKFEPADGNATRDAPLAVVSQGYYSLSSNQMAFHQNNPYQSQVSGITNETVGQLTRSQQEASDSKNLDVAIETKKSESPTKPPINQRKSVDAEFFTKEQAPPPPPPLSNTRHKLQQQLALKEQQRKVMQQHLLRQQQRPRQNHPDYDNPNHSFAEIIVKTRLPPSARQGSDCSASLAMTSVSSITCRGSLFSNDSSHESNTWLPFQRRFWGTGSTVVKIDVSDEENYFDYSNDNTFHVNRAEESEGLVDRLANTVNQVYDYTCQCLGVGAFPLPVPSDGTNRESNSTVGADAETFNTTVYGTNQTVEVPVTLTVG